MSKRFFTKINKNGRNVIIDKECHIEIIDLTLACEVLNRLDTKRRWLNDENEQLRNIIKQKEEEEQLYAKEILRLNELNKQTSEFTDILGGY